MIENSDYDHQDNQQVNYFDYEKLSQFLSVKKSTLYAWVSRNEIPFIRISSRCVRFDFNQIKAWLKNKQKSCN
ncbi:MAG TPA: helix-turn-helix domain-containing protein [Oligoflexia bacterium]|nr:helix-turn-helix domain-containing protein [Oligoflexia bacterium]HMR25361.1 helix-turn-helix domain-containing protein [Oligoflexia bacterium]